MPRKEHIHHYIYKTTCSVNDKYYIGMHSTSNLEDGYMGSGKRLWFSMQKHGRENHRIEILEWCTNREHLRNREREIVNESLLGDSLCMNLKPGGDGGLSTEEHRKKFQEKGNEAFKRNLQDPVQRARILQNLSKALTGLKQPNIHNDHNKDRVWITNGAENKFVREEEFSKFQDAGWRKGKVIKKKVKWNPWNKGMPWDADARKAKKEKLTS